MSDSTTLPPSNAVVNGTATGEDATSAFVELVEALRRGDSKAAAACFTREGCIRTPDATVVSGRQGVREVLNQLVALPLIVEASLTSLTTSGDVALGRGTWVVRSEGQGRRHLHDTCGLTVVFCRVEGAWKVSIAFPWGG